MNLAIIEEVQLVLKEKKSDKRQNFNSYSF